MKFHIGVLSTFAECYLDGVTLDSMEPINDDIGIGAWQAVYVMLHQFFNDIINRNSFNSNSRFSQTNH